MSRTNSTDWAPWNPVTSARLQDFNEDIDNIYATGSDHFKVYHLSAQPALQVTIGPGTFRVWGTEWQYAGWTLTVSASVTTYIMIDTAGVIQTSTTAWNSLYTRLAVVVSGVSTITSITDWRNKVVGGVLWGIVFDDTQGTNTTPNDYNDSTFKAQLKTITNIGLNGIAEWTYARLIWWRGQMSSTFGLAYETAYTDSWIYHRTWATTTWNAWEKIWKMWIDFFGTGADGNVTISSNTTLTRDMHYNNLTVNTTFTLNTDWYSVYVKEKLLNNGTIADNWSNAFGTTPWGWWHFRKAWTTASTISNDYLWKWGKWGWWWTFVWSPALQDNTYTGWKFTPNNPYDIGRILANRFIGAGGVTWQNGWFWGYNPGAWGGSAGLVYICAMRVLWNGAFNAIWWNGAAAATIDAWYGSGGGGGWSGGAIFIITNHNWFTGTNNVSGGTPWATSGALVPTAWDPGIYKMIII